MEMSEECHFSVKVPRVQCLPSSIRKGSILDVGKRRLCTCAAVAICWQAAEGWNETPSHSSLKGQNSHSRQTSSWGCPQFAMFSSHCPPVRITVSLSRTGNYFSLFLDTFRVSSCLRCGFKCLLWDHLGRMFNTDWCQENIPLGEPNELYMILSGFRFSHPVFTHGTSNRVFGGWMLWV